MTRIKNQTERYTLNEDGKTMTIISTNRIDEVGDNSFTLLRQSEDTRNKINLENHYRLRRYQLIEAQKVYNEYIGIISKLEGQIAEMEGLKEELGQLTDEDILHGSIIIE